MRGCGGQIHHSRPRGENKHASIQTYRREASIAEYGVDEATVYGGAGAECGQDARRGNEGGAVVQRGRHEGEVEVVWVAGSAIFRPGESSPGWWLLERFPVDGVHADH